MSIRGPAPQRGGWTWYTGSARWLYRAGTEAILAFRLQGAFLLLDPCIPKAWPRFEIIFKHRVAHYEITVENRRASPAASPPVRWTARHCRTVRPECPLWMTVQPTRCT
jgi:cellobiose phosphorylase